MKRVVLVTIVAGLVASCRAGARGGPPDVLLVTLDTTRADHLGVYGARGAATPVVDKLASEGAIFEHAWAAAPLTTPSHASLLTGLYPAAHGVRNNGRFRLPSGAATLASVFAEAGYDTGAFVGAFPVSRPFGLSRGFATFDDDFGADARGRSRSERRAGDVNARALPWIRRAASSNRPFFAWVHYYDAHDPYEPPPPFDARFADRPYDGEIAYADSALGEVIDALRKAGCLDRTIVVVAGDHGEGLGEHGETTHGLLLYEPMLRVPLLVRAPWTVRPGTRRDDLASLVDVAPTIAALAGLTWPVSIDGRDLFARGPADSGDDPTAPGPGRAIYAETFFAAEEFGWSPLLAVRRGGMKWIEAPRPERYDLDVDPAESSDLAGREKAKDATMSRLLATVASASISRRVGDAAASVDDDLLARLQSLGYVGGGGTGAPAAGAGASGRDPKDGVEDYNAYLRGTEAINAGDDAVPLFARLVASDPANPEFRLRLGQAYKNRGDLRASEATYRELIRLYPDFYLAYRRLATLLNGEGRAADGRDLWLALQARHVPYVGIEARLAEAFLATGESDRALVAARDGLGRTPDDAELLVLAARASERLGKDADALDAYRKALAIKPAQLEALDGALALLRRLGRPSEAKDLAAECARRAPGDAAVAARSAGI